MEDPSGAYEWAVTVFASLFSLVLLVCLLWVVWSYVLLPAGRLLSRRQGTAVAPSALALVGRPAPHGPDRTPDELRDDLLAALGGRSALVGDLSRRLEGGARAIIRRRIGDQPVAKSASDLADLVVRRWVIAKGRVPRALRDFPPPAWTMAETWETGDTAQNFANEWNSRTWLHEDGGRSTVTADELLLDGLMTPQEFVDWSVDAWAEELRQMYTLGCADIFLVPPFFVAFASIGLDNIGLDGWLAVALALVALVPFMFVWREIRRYITWEE